MSRKVRHPVTRAVHRLRAEKIPFTPHLYDYVPRGGTAASSAALGVDEHRVIKTLIFETDERAPLIALMHGDREVSTRALARAVGAKTVRPCSPDVADRHSGYQVGGTSPFGTRREMPVYAQSSIATLERLYINGGSRGFLIELATADLIRVLRPTLVEISTGS